MEQENEELRRKQVILRNLLDEKQITQNLQNLQFYNSIIILCLEDSELSQLPNIILQQDQLIDFTLQVNDETFNDNSSIISILQSLSALPKLKTFTLRLNQILEQISVSSAFKMAIGTLKLLQLKNLNLIFPNLKMISLKTSEILNEGILNLQNLTSLNLNISLIGKINEIKCLRALIKDINTLKNLTNITLAIKVDQTNLRFLRQDMKDIDFIILRECLFCLDSLKKLELILVVSERNLYDFELFFDSLFELKNLNNLNAEIVFCEPIKDYTIHLFKNLRIPSHVEELTLNLHSLYKLYKKKTNKIEFNEEGIMMLQNLRQLQFSSKILIPHQECEKLLKLLSQQSQKLTKLKIQFLEFQVNSHLMAYYLKSLTALNELILDIEFEKEQKNNEFNQFEIVESISNILNLEVLLLKGDKNLLTSQKGKGYIENFQRLAQIKAFTYICNKSENIKRYLSFEFITESLLVFPNLVQLEVYVYSNYFKNELETYASLIFNAFKDLQNLKVLKFGIDAPLQHEIKSLRHLRNLQELYFESKNFEDLRQDAFYTLRRLNQFTLYKQGSSGIFFHKFQKKCIRKQSHLVLLNITNKSMLI